MNRIIVFPLLLSMLLLAGCSNDSDDPVGSENRPVISRISVSNPLPRRSESVDLIAYATDEDGDELSYRWGVRDGSIDGTIDDSTLRWIAPNRDCRATILLSVSDGDHTVHDSITVSVGVRESSYSQAYGGSAADRGNRVALLTDNTFGVIGTTASFGHGGDDIWLLYLDYNGNLIDSHTYGGSSDDQGMAILAHPEGGVVIAGTRTDNEGGHYIWLAHVDASGDVVWEEQFEGYGWARVYDIAPTMDDGYAIAGQTFQGGENVALVIRLSVDRETIWETTAFPGVATGISADADGAYFILGINDSGVAVTCTVNSFGTVVDGPNEYRSLSLHRLIHAGSNQHLLIGGNVNGYYLHRDGLTSDLTSWRVEDDGEQITMGYAGCMMADNGAVLIGTTQESEDAIHDLVMVRITHNGRRDWSKIYGGDDDDYGYDIIRLPDGFAVTGRTFSQGLGGGDLWFLRIFNNVDSK